MESKELIFPRNILGTSISLKDNCEEVMICCDYHGRYEDDDFGGIVYNKKKKAFRTLCWSTRGAYCGCVESGPFTDINDCDEATVNEIIEKAKETLLADEKQYKVLYDECERRIRCQRKYKYQDEPIANAVAKLPEVFKQKVSEVSELRKAISLIYNGGYFGYDMGEWRGGFLNDVLYTFEDIFPRKRAARPVKYYGNDYEGRVTFVAPVRTFYGSVIFKVYFVTDDDKKFRFWSNTAVSKGERIVVNGVEDEVYCNDCTMLKKAKIVK